MNEEQGQTAGPAEERCYREGTGPSFSRFARSFGPPESVQQHFRQARIEVLKGIREMIDLKIERLSRTDRRGTKVTVE